MSPIASGKLDITNKHLHKIGPDKILKSVLADLKTKSGGNTSGWYVVLSTGRGKDRKYYVWKSSELEGLSPEQAGLKMATLPGLKDAEAPYKNNYELESIEYARDILDNYHNKLGSNRLVILDSQGEIEGLLVSEMKGDDTRYWTKAKPENHFAPDAKPEKLYAPDAKPEKLSAPDAKPARFLNACLEDVEHNQTVLPGFDLVVKGYYDLHVDIGPLSAESAVVNPGSFPEDKLPPSSEGWWLEAIAVSDDFKVDQKRHPFFLPLHGPSWVCTCQPDGPHTCTPLERQSHLVIPLMAPMEPGTHTLRLTIYFKKNALESLLLTAHVSPTRQPGEGYRLVTDYRLTARLDSVDFLPERRLNILVNQNLNGTHRLVINGQAGDPLSFSLGDDAMRKATNTLRLLLNKIHYSKSGLLGHKNNYDEKNAKTKEAFIKDLKALAEKGWELYDVISNKVDLSVDEPATIQIARAASEFIFPWAFIYDIGKESFADWQPCQLLQDWDGKSTLIPSGTRNCPHENNHVENTLCPFGFWGYRHILEQPASINLENTDRMKQVIHTPGQLDFTFIQNTTLDPSTTSLHVAALQKSLGSTWKPVTNRPDVKIALDQEAPEIIYFYVHGKKLAEDSLAPTSLLVGNDEEIQTTDIKAWYKSGWKINPNHWVKSSPLIFINGCHTADLLPDSPVSFVDEFSRAAAAGVVGTEITISQRVASEMAEIFLSSFVNKTPAGERISVGEALRLARLNLLNKGNLLGLVYSAYCAADLALD